jgi:hypothetical protein
MTTTVLMKFSRLLLLLRALVNQSMPVKRVMASAADCFLSMRPWLMEIQGQKSPLAAG